MSDVIAYPEQTERSSNSVSQRQADGTKRALMMTKVRRQVLAHGGMLGLCKLNCLVFTWGAFPKRS